MKFNIPNEIQSIADKLIASGHQVYLVGGCLRDLLIGRIPGDWDVATDAKPDEIKKIFPESVYENEFGTVGIKTARDEESLKIVEATTFRREGKYTDKRRPDEVHFAETIEEDLARRDFTVNAIAFRLTFNNKQLTINEESESESHTSNVKGQMLLVDPFGGLKDIEKKTIRSVGDPERRFEEDALRLLRGVRLATQLDFVIEEKTAEAIKIKAHLLEFIAKERIRDEIAKLVMASNASWGVSVLEEVGLLKYILSELREGINVGQNKHHVYTVWEHNIRSLKYSAGKNYSLVVRLASLLHDVGKPRTKEGDGPESTFYGHQVVGAKMAAQMLDRLRFSKEIIERVALLVREHMFVYDPEAVTLAGVRRLLRRVGDENIDDLIKLREADRIGSGVPKAQPYRLRYLKAMIEKVKSDPIGVKMLKLNGTDIMDILKIPPGPRVGMLLFVMLEDALDNPDVNSADNLKRRLSALDKLSDAELLEMSKKAKESATRIQERIDDEIKKKYFVK